mmetsp:Transcript_9550/g.17494  ORF Transcript_9550/g.17494 Transcript_9550/m.17494 type:complete len:509 (-) Transcript_9550:171-1697(-)|eukprot:CAMPEP_0196140132 /NCGR_PEP_ID=MMETSP0910-20130528/7146_1 /TAXON_ID=49265 /ORGANISM="Thalassiosira rotula, Strain GSO102" /LENGTH=508 /DNA_ID=CAMNT_0041400951 /DNA_START=135 /DNA_END=1661 /DNA_ORIENTATION=+
MTHVTLAALALIQFDTSSFHVNALLPFVVTNQHSRIIANNYQCQADFTSSRTSSAKSSGLVALSSTAFERAFGASNPPPDPDVAAFLDFKITSPSRLGMPLVTHDGHVFEEEEIIQQQPNLFEEEQEIIQQTNNDRQNYRQNVRRPMTTHRQVITGRGKRAGWESYASINSASSSRNYGAIIGGEIGSPGGRGDWQYTSSYGPATTTAATAADAATATSPKPLGGIASSSSTNNQRTVITGRDRRASFDSFSPFVTHSNAMPRLTGSSPSTPSPEIDAATVAATLSAMPSAQTDDDVTAPASADDVSLVTTEDIPMDTPARQSLPPHLSLSPIPGKGLGVITLKPIANGELVGYYQGEVMSEEVKDRRYLPSLQHTLTSQDEEWIQSRLDRGQTLTGCYLYGISLPDDDMYNRFNTGSRGGGRNEDEDAAAKPPNRIYVDAEDEYESLWTRFLNHASPPYNNVNPKSVHESYDGQPKVWFMANRDIEVGEEICFDYGEDYWLEGDEVY